MVSPDPAFAPSEIADALSVDKETARRHMDRMVEDGYLQKKKPSRRQVMYWVTPSGKEFYAENTS